jgi:hypothetical protein
MMSEVRETTKLERVLSPEREAERTRMTALGTLMTLFPALVMCAALASLVWFVLAPGVVPILTFLSVLYLLPLVAYRLHARVHPLREGASLIVGRGYSAWYGSHQLQLIYVAFPALETLLRLVPGLFSLWLRAWGSRVGRQVYWTPHVEILDRGLLEIGDGVIFGHRSGMSAHVIRPTRGNLLLYVKRVRIGAGVFIGAGSYIGPGAAIEQGAMIPAASHIMPRQKVPA